MAVYKLIQDIEAEDKLLGPLTLKAFIYALITAGLGFINYQLIMASSFGAYRWPFVIIILMPMILFAVLASPLGRDQPTEVWLLSHIRFFLKPRVRVWDQNGVKDLVTITAPKKVEEHLTKEFDSQEAKSRLKTLASTLDSRGWAVKNVAVNDTSFVSYLESKEANQERLVSAQSVLQDQPVATDVSQSDDILDEQHNAKAKEVEKLLENNEQQRKEQVNQSLHKMAAKPSSKKSLFHPPPTKAPAKRAVTHPHQTAKLKGLAQSGNALSVASVAKLAKPAGGVQQVGPNEVVISLH